MIVDSDLHDNGARAHFERLIADWAPESRLVSELGVHPVATAKSQTEQEEPLLLLADYLAGAYQHADPRTTLTSPVVTPNVVMDVIARLRKRLRERLFEETEEFNERYPLVIHGGKVLPRHEADALGVS
jgi:hypothetical protein